MLSPANTKRKRKKTKKPCLSHHTKIWVTKAQSPETLGSYKVVTLLLRDCPVLVLYSVPVPGISRATSRPLRYLHTSQTDSKLSEDNHQELQDLLHTKEGDAGQSVSDSACMGSSLCD